MKLTPIKDSAVIAAHAHDPETGKMRVRMHNGSVYEYDDVSLEKYAAFTGAASAGAFYGKNIKSAHVGRKISGPTATPEDGDE